jgi:hypothetical protein
MLNQLRNPAGVPYQGTDLMQIFAPHFTIIALRRGVARQGMMDDTGQQHYRFHTDR